MFRFGLATLLALAISTLTLAAEPKVVQRGYESGEAQSPYALEIQRSAVRYDGYYFWGKITNPEVLSVDDLSIIFTAYGADDKFLARTRTSLNASSQAGVGYFDGVNLETGVTPPARIVWEIGETKQSVSIADIKVAESADTTANDAPLNFVVQRVAPNYSGYSVWGKVENHSTKEYSNLQVIVAAFDSDGRLLSRTRASVTPDEVGPGQVGYVDGAGLEIQGPPPRNIEWKVMAAEY